MYEKIFYAQSTFKLMKQVKFLLFIDKIFYFFLKRLLFDDINMNKNNLSHEIKSLLFDSCRTLLQLLVADLMENQHASFTSLKQMYHFPLNI